MSEVYLVGLDHFLQNEEAFCSTAAGIESERQQKQHFETFLRNLIQQNEVDLIAEEGTFEPSCLGCRLARELKLKYAAITMPQSERDRLGILNNYEDQEDTLAAAIRAFEDYMLEQVAAHEDAKGILLLCGRLHLDPLQRGLAERGHEVRPYDVTDYEWFQGRPMEDNGGVVGYCRQH
jgi:hypothetical protein